MEKQWMAAVIGGLAVVCVVTDVSAYPQYVVPTGAAGCTSCHLTSSGAGYQPGILTAAASPLGKIAGLKAFLHPAVADTKPVLHPINPKWDVTVGETPLVMPLQVSDAENDSFTLHGSAPTGYTVSQVYSKNNLPTIDFKWTPTAAQANKIYPLKLYVKETGTGRTLASNTVTATIQVWPARVSATRNISQFIVQGAQWKNNTLRLAGQLVFKSTLTSAQRAKALKNLTMHITSGSGSMINAPVNLSLQANGYWVKTLALTGSEVPCTVKLDYEGFKAVRTVSLVSTATCVK